TCRPRGDLPVRGPGEGLRSRRRPLLSLPLPTAASCGARAELRRGRRAGSAPRDHRVAPGERGAEADSRSRGLARGTAAPLRRSRDDARRGHRPSRSGVPRVRRAPDDHRVHRLRRVLQRTAPAGLTPPMTLVRIPPTLRADGGGVRELEASGDTVGDVIDDLVERYPPLRDQLLQNGGAPSFLNVFLGGGGGGHARALA